MAQKRAPELGAFFLFFASLWIFIFPFEIGQKASFLVRTLPKLTEMLATTRPKVVSGKSMDSPEKRKVDKMAENVEKMFQKCPKIVWGGRNHNFRTFLGQFLAIGSMLLFGDPVQCSPATSLRLFEVCYVAILFTPCRRPLLVAADSIIPLSGLPLYPKSKKPLYSPCF